MVILHVFKTKKYGNSDHSIYRVSACTAYPAFL